MNTNHDNADAREIHDAQLTAFALEQLWGREREAAEELVARSEKARRQVEESAALAGQVRHAYEATPALAPSAALREAVERQLQQEETAEKPTAAEKPAHAGHRRRWLWALAAAGCAACAAAALILPEMLERREMARNYPLAAAQEARETGPYYYSNDDVQYSALPAQPAPSAEPTPKDRPADAAEGYAGILNDGSISGRNPAKPTNGKKPVMLAQQIGSSNAAIPYDDNGPGEMPPSSTSPPTGMESGYSHAGEGRTNTTPDSSRKADQEKPTSPMSPTPRTIIKEEEDEKPRFVRQIPGKSKHSGEWKKHGEKLGQDGRKLSESALSAYDPELSNDVDWKRADPHQPSGPGTEHYEGIADNPFLAVARQPLSTFSIDVDTASYANVRRFLNEGRLPPPDAVRIEEMVNYFQYNYAPPKDATPFAVHLETAECPWRPDHRLVRIGLKGREIDRRERGPSNLVFLLDVSGSMGEPNKLPLVKQSMRMLVEQLREDDRVAIVTYADGTGVRLPSARGNEKQRILDAIDALQAGGCTNGGAGIQLAYSQAAEHFVEKGTNRVILCTDGDLNVGITSDDDLVRLIQQKAKTGVFLTVLGFGTGNLKDSKMEKLADKGNGLYAYIDGLREAHRVLVEQMAGSLVTIAKDVKIQVEFNPAQVAGYRLVGYENRVMANRDFHNDRKDAGEIGAGHTVTALYEIVPARAAQDDENLGDSEHPLKYQRVPEAKPERELTESAASDELLTVRLRYKEPDGSKSRLIEFAARDGEKRFGQASADFRFASSVAAFGLVLRGSPHRGRATLAAVEEYAASALGRDPNGHRAEFLDLVRKAKGLGGKRLKPLAVSQALGTEPLAASQRLFQEVRKTMVRVPPNT